MDSSSERKDKQDMYMSWDMNKHNTKVGDIYRCSDKNAMTSSSVARKERRSFCTNKKRNTKSCERFDFSSSDDEDLPSYRKRRQRPRRSPRIVAVSMHKKCSSSSVTSVSADNKSKISPLNNREICRGSKTADLDDNDTDTNAETKSFETTHTDTPNSITTLGFVTPPKPFSEQPLCVHCGNKGYACHNYMYGSYCTKACFHYLQHNTIGWESGFDFDAMEKVFNSAYIEKRRVELEERHGYYNHEWEEVPTCMKLKSFKNAVLLGDNPRLCKELSMHNEAGLKQYLEAKRNFKG